MKKIILLMISSIMSIILLVSCSSSNTNSDKEINNNMTESNVLDLTGEWKQTNSQSEDTYLSATITEDKIVIYWVTDNGDTKSLYWSGSYTPPKSSIETYSWESVRNKEDTENAILSSNAETKTFKYENKSLVYEVTMMGVISTIRLEKQ